MTKSKFTAFYFQSFWGLFILTLLGCTSEPSERVLNSEAQLQASQAVAADTAEGQIIGSGSLMIKSAANELLDQGFSLDEVKSIADKADKRLRAVGALALPGSTSSLALSEEKLSLNPLSIASDVVMSFVSKGILSSSSSKINKDYKLLSKAAKSIHRSLKDVKEDQKISPYLNDTYFEGAVSKITGTAIGLVADYGVESKDLNNVMKEVTDDFIEELEESKVLSSDTEIAKKVISGLAQGATKIEYENVKMSDEANPSTLANNLAFDIYNKETGSNLSKTNEGDFDLMIDIILDGAVK